MALENKLGLTNATDLAREEERISKKKALELFDSGLLDQLEAGKFSPSKQFISIFSMKLRFCRRTQNRKHFQRQLPFCAADVLAGGTCQH